LVFIQIYKYLSIEKSISGLFWPVPIMNTVKAASAFSGAMRIALRDPNDRFEFQ